MSNLQIGLIQGLEQQIERTTAPELQYRWSQSEEIQFQYAITVHCTKETRLGGLRNEDMIYSSPELGCRWEW